MKEYLFKAVEYWIDNYDIDGLRFDAANCLDMDFLREISGFCRSKKKDFWLMGEIIHGDYNKWANDSMLDSITNYECYKGIYSSHNDKNYFEIAYSINRQSGDYGIYKNILLYNFLDNHDVNRIASTLKKQEYLELAYTLLFTMPGVPSIYYGSEWGIYGIKENNSDSGLRPELNLQTVQDTSADKNLIAVISELSKIRKNSDVFKYGIYKQILLRNQQFAFARISDNENCNNTA